MSSEPETTDPPETSPPLFRAFRDRQNRARRGPFLACLWLLVGTCLIVTAVLFVGMACKNFH